MRNKSTFRRFVKLALWKIRCEDGLISFCRNNEIFLSYNLANVPEKRMKEESNIEGSVI